MKTNMRLKDFNTFINEELHPSTYFEAGKRLRLIGHRERGDKLIQYGEEMSKNVEPITVELFGETYTVGVDDITWEKDFSLHEDAIVISFDKNYPWPVPIILDDEEDEKYTENMVWVMYHFIKHPDRYEFSYKDGVTKIVDRKAAVKIKRLLNDYSKTLKDKKLADAILKLSVNQIYGESQ